MLKTLTLVSILVLVVFQAGLLHHYNSHHVCQDDPNNADAADSRCFLCQAASQFDVLLASSPAVPVLTPSAYLDVKTASLTADASHINTPARSPPHSFSI